MALVGSRFQIPSVGRIAAVAVLILTLCSSESLQCKAKSTCQCKEPGHCHLFCDQSVDQCYQANLICHPGDDCTIYCIGATTCKDTKISGWGAQDVQLLCHGTPGADACKG